MSPMDEAGHPVPELWLTKFAETAAALVVGDFQLRKFPVDGVDEVDQAIANSFAANVAAYGDRLAALNEATWDWSVVRWMGSYWQVLVDLSTVNEPVSDIPLHARVKLPAPAAPAPPARLSLPLVRRSSACELPN